MSLTQDRSSGVDGEEKQEELKEDEEGSKEDTATGGECVRGGLSFSLFVDQLSLCFCKIKAAAAINSVALMVEKRDAASNVGTDEL